MKKTVLAVALTAFFTAALTAAALALGAAWLAGGFLVDLTLRRGTEDDPAAPPAVFRTVIEGTGKAIRPAPRPGFSSEAWALRSFDGLALRATHFAPAEESRRWVLLLHGYGLSQAHVWNYADAYLKRGYHVVTPDMRASGESDGAYLTMGALEARDAVLWIRRIAEIDPGARVVLHGVSMGAAAAMLAAAEPDLPPQAAAVVEDSGYSDARALFALELEKLLALPPFPLLDCVSRVCETRAGFSLADASPVEAVRRARVPTLFIHGASDRLVPAAMARTLYDACAAPEKEWLLIETIGHGALYQSKHYYSAVFAFTDRQTESP